MTKIKHEIVDTEIHRQLNGFFGGKRTEDSSYHIRYHICVMFWCFMLAVLHTKVCGDFAWKPEGSQFKSSSDQMVQSVDWWLKRCQFTSWALPRCP